MWARIMPHMRSPLPMCAGILAYASSEALPRVASLGPVSEHAAAAPRAAGRAALAVVLVSATSCVPQVAAGATAAQVSSIMMGTGSGAYGRLLDACSYGGFGWDNASFAVMSVDLPCATLIGLGNCDNSYPHRLSAAVVAS